LDATATVIHNQPLSVSQTPDKVLHHYLQNKAMKRHDTPTEIYSGEVVVKNPQYVREAWFNSTKQSRRESHLSISLSTQTVDCSLPRPSLSLPLSFSICTLLTSLLLFAEVDATFLCIKVLIWL
jgi:hypothetical protein